MAGVPFFVPRVFGVAAACLLATATITFAAEHQISASAPPATPPPPSKPEELVVPDVRKQAYVFAKGSLEEAGFAWKLSGGAPGYAANTVVGQSPAPGTRVVNTGAPTITLQLAANRRYVQRGAPEPASPYPGTRLQLAGVAVPKKTAPAAAAPPAQPAKKSASSTPKPAPKPAAKPAAARPPAFVVPGAPKEPLNEMPLPDRARALDRWLAAHPKRTPANVNHWLYQHQWIVSGAQFGWSRGAEALRILIEADRRAQAQWGVGAKSEALARSVLREVEAKAQ